MAVERSSVVDAVGIEKDSGIVVLTILDQLPWSGEHLATLQRKINGYLAFLESGEIYRSYPDAKGRPLRIDVVAKFRPSDEASAFLDRAANTLQAAGLQFKYGPSVNGYEGDG